MTEIATPFQGRSLDARFTLLEKLGSGGQGEVWRAHDETRGIDIALKVPANAAQGEGAVAAFEREHAIVARLNHQSVLKVFPPHRSGDVVVLPMELATGGDLRRLRGAGYLDIIPVLLDIAQALEHAHERGVIHRDLKPGNVLFDARGSVKLADFGAAGTTSTTAADARMQGLSPFTASPEQLRGEAPTESDDIYGLGALAYELLSGYPPYYPHFDLRRAQEEPVPNLVPTRQIPPLLSALVMRMLAKNPRARPQSMREVIDDLDVALNDTLTFDFEALVEPTRGAPGAAVSMEPDDGPRAAWLPAADAPAPAARKEAQPPAQTAQASVGERHDEREDEDVDERELEHGGPDLGLIPDLLVANQLVVTPTPRRNRAGSAAREAGAAASSMWLPPGGSNDRAVFNDTMQLPAAARGSSAHDFHNDTVQLPPEPGAGLREKIAAVSGAARATGPALTHGYASTAQAARAAADGMLRGPILTNSSPTATTTEPVPPSAATPGATTFRPTPDPPLQQPALATAGFAAAGGGPSITPERPLWESLQLEAVPRITKLEPIRRRRWPLVLLGALAGIAVAVFYWLPRYAPQALPLDLEAFSSRVSKSFAPATQPPSTLPPDEATAATTAGPDKSAEAKLQATRENFDRRLAALEARGAGVWGGAEFAMAKTRAAESVGAHDAGNTQIAQDRLADASHLLDEVESRAPQALAAELAAGQKALAAGQEEVANQAFELAKRIDPNDRRIAEGQKRTHNLDGVLPLLADAQNAENARNYYRAAQDYNQALSLDAGNDKARAGLARAKAAFADDNYAKAVGSGFAALGAGRIDDARDAFQKARALRPNGVEAAEGLRRVSAAQSAKGFASLRQKAAALETQERWDDAAQLYNSALHSDPSLAFAQEGRDRAAARDELGASLQALIDRPERLASQAVRNQVRALLETANTQSPSGPVLRSQIARMGILLSDYDSSSRQGTMRGDLLQKPVRLSLVSDNATAVTIPSIGQFGTFAKRDIELKPGRYTVIGTRAGYRDVRRDITISPGQDSQTISVSCSDPI